MAVDHTKRAHALLSASSAERWLACPPSAVAAEAYPRQDTEYTREGTIAHEVAEIVARARLNGEKPTEYPEGYDQEMIECAERYADYIQEHIKHDGAIVLLERRVDFSPWVPEGFGTCDCIIIQGDTLTVIDYKYGKGVAVEAKGNPQMRLYALGALNAYGFAYDIDKVETHIFQPRISNNSADSLTAEDLTAWAEETVKPTAALAAKAGGKYTPGKHCKFCPHAGNCVQLMNVCTKFVSTHGLRVQMPVLAPFQVAEILQMEPLISLWLKRVKELALTTLLDGGEVPGYKVVEGKLGNRKWVDELKVAETLKGAGYQLEDITETKLLSPAAMDKAIGKKRAAELLDGLTDRAPGAPTVVPESDKRQPFDRLAEAQKDFE